jgi:hypothetical protein
MSKPEGATSPHENVFIYFLNSNAIELDFFRNDFLITEIIIFVV